MIQEYLFVTEEFKDNIEKIDCQENVTRNIYEIKKDKLWILKYELKDEKEESARVLSLINRELHVLCKPFILQDGSSEFFDKELFPLINQFERKLRKLLYLASRISENDEHQSKISELEEQDFGTIFNLLFIDGSFVNDVKTAINGKKGSSAQFTRKEIINIIQSIPENTLWDSLLGKECVMTLRENFEDVRNYRNDVMHAHHMDEENYDRARSLFTKVNNEIDVAIDCIVDNKNTSSKTKVSKNYNKLLESALFELSESMKIIDEKMYDNRLIEMQKRLNMYQQMFNAPVLLKMEELSEQLKGISNGIPKELTNIVGKL